MYLLEKLILKYCVLDGNLSLVCKSWHDEVIRLKLLEFKNCIDAFSWDDVSSSETDSTSESEEFREFLLISRNSCIEINSITEKHVRTDLMFNTAESRFMARIFNRNLDEEKEVLFAKKVAEFCGLDHYVAFYKDPHFRKFLTNHNYSMINTPYLLKYGCIKFNEMSLK